MKMLLRSFTRFITNDQGPTAVEYAVMMALIVIVCLVGIRAVGTNVRTTFNNVSTQLGS